LPEFRSGNEVAFSAIVFGVGWSAGQVMRGWERRHQQLGSDLLTLAESAALREQAAATAERTRIARELHDVVAHSVSVMVVQAGSARLRMRRDPRGAEEALLAVESTGRQALGELRQLLGLLRTDAAPTGVEPQPGLASLDTLVEQARDSGLDVTVQVVGPVRALPPGLDLSAYRIVQEALTNVRKHTGPAAVTVRLQYDVTSLDLRVHNASGHRQARLAGGAPLGRGRGGHGLLGMRERVSLFGGRVDAGPDGDGGFLVHATLPLPVTGEPVTTPAEWTP
jgi:signal transduction histidine kinase